MPYTFEHRITLLEVPRKPFVRCYRKYWSITSDQYIRCQNMKVNGWKYCLECSQNHHRKPRKDTGKEHATPRFYCNVFNPTFCIDIEM